MYRLIVFIRFGKFLIIISPNILSASFSHSGPSHYAYVECFKVLHRYLKLYSFFLIHFLFCSSDRIVLINLS